MTTTTYVAVHDADLIRDAEQDGQFDGLPNLTWLFLGPRPVPLTSFHPIVQCVNYAPDRPNLYDFAGFDVLVHANLMRSEHAIFLQYDHEVQDRSAGHVLDKLLDADLSMVSFVPAGYDPGNWMLQVPDFAPVFHAALRACGEMGDWSTLTIPWWPTTQGHAWRTSYFYTFLNWVRPALDVIASHPFGGHMAERLLTVFCESTHPARVHTDLFLHTSKDCHGTSATMFGRHEEAAEKAALFGR